MIGNFTSFSIVSQSYKDDGMIMKRCAMESVSRLKLFLAPTAIVPGPLGQWVSGTSLKKENYLELNYRSEKITLCHCMNLCLVP